MSDRDRALCSQGCVHQRGFTLLEIMAVVIIIAIVVSFAGLSLGSRAQDERLANEAERLHQLLKLAAEEAQVQGDELGLLVANDGYRFYHLDNNRWSAYQDGSLRERHLPDGMRLFLAQDRKDEVQIPIKKQDSKKKDEKQDPPPQILLLSSGELTPFTMELHAEHLAVFYRAEGKITGDIEVRRIQQERQ